ncbi:MAG: outer membrane protein assembly factor BamB family protein [Gaiellaceae bacterium]
MRRLVIVGAVLVALAAGGALAWYLHVRHASRDVRGSSTVEFVTTEAAPPPPPEPGIAWPTYGHDAEHLRFGNGIALAPPYKRIWTFRAQSLVEFPPAIGYGRLFFSNNAGVMFALGAKNGKRAWKLNAHRCVASSPALDRHVVYQAYLNGPPCNRKPSASLTGEVVAYAVGTGRVIWRRRIGPSETSPVVSRASIFVGDWDGRVWALRRKTGKTRWVTQLQGQVKGAVAISGDRIFVGDYSGHLYALSYASGKVLWKSKLQPRFGGAGNIYATPSAAYGRVYVGATDGKVYSFGGESGKLRWSQSTGGYVYSSTAVWRDRVYAGSYSKRFFCFDAATGRILWQFKANGQISGSPTVISGRVYFATLSGRTYALDARSGSLLWTFPDGKYSPVVADAKRLYLIGYARIYGLVPSASAGTVTSPELRRLRTSGVTMTRYASRQAAATHGGVQVCNVVLRRRGAPPGTFWATVKRVQAACRG